MRVRRVGEDPEKLQCDLEFVRLTRNTGKEWMTGNRSFIQPGQQFEWFMLEAPDLWVFEDDFNQVGYALITERGEDGKLWISLAVRPGAQGHGVGTWIYETVAQSYGGTEIFAEIFKSNIASRRAAEKAGYQVVEETADTVVMKS